MNSFIEFVEDIDGEVKMETKEKKKPCYQTELHILFPLIHVGFRGGLSE